MADDGNELDPTELSSTEAAASPTEGRQQIGPYRLLQKIGEGGMGEVWQAEQSEPVRRTVALKIIKRGMDTKQVVARFEAERQALALMDHPAVAKVFDAGATPRGRPYFVLEHVQGVPITEYCDRHKLSNHERLALFNQVCEGVQHAHQKGVIHRDLKPSNVLVGSRDGKPVAKIIDFGVAKATAQKLTERTLYTELGVLIGTPEYMSPEQAEITGEDVDTRTDVYSLGVVLYELLTGALPFDSKELRSGGYEGIRRKIREEEPPRPSARLSTLGDEPSRESAARRKVDLPTLRSQLRGDLDWIVMRALEKDRTRRYGSPSELAADVERHLKYQPVLAGPPSALYRARKFVRRHRVGVGLAAVGVAVLVGFAATMAVQSSRIAAERDRANREREASDRVSEFLADMLGDVDPEMLGIALREDLRDRVAEVRRGRGATEDEVEATLANLSDALSGVNATDAALHLLDKQVLARAGATVEQQLAEEPRIASRLEQTLGKTYRRLGLYEAAEPHAVRALETRRRLLGDDHPDTLDSMNDLKEVYIDQHRWTEAETLLREVVETRKRVLGEDHPDTLNSMYWLAMLYFNQGRSHDDGVEPLILETLETSRRALGESDPGTLRAMHLLSMLYGNQGRYDEAEPLALKVLEIRRRVLGDDHPMTRFSIRSLARMYRNLGRYAEAEELFLEAITTAKRLYGDEHKSALWDMWQLANTYETQRRYDEAEPLYIEVLAIRRRVFGDDHPDTLSYTNLLATKYRNQGRYDDAESLYLEILETRKRVLRDDHPDTLKSMSNLADLYQKHGRYDHAEPLYLETVETRKRVLGNDHRDTLNSMNNLAIVYHRQGRYDEAEPLFLETLETRRRVLGDDHPDTLKSMNRLARLYRATGRTEKARPLVKEVLSFWGRTAEAADASAEEKNRYAWTLLTCEPTDLRNPREALRFSLESNELTRHENPSYLDTLSLAYHLTGDTAKAIENQQRAIALLPDGDSPLRRSLEEALARFEVEK